MYDDESEVRDQFYGATQYGWKRIAEDVTEEHEETLLYLGIRFN